MLRGMLSLRRQPHAIRDTFTVGNERTLFILPTREGIFYVGLILITLVAGINYANGLAYALTFLLGAVGIVATLHTHRNLSGVQLSAGAAAPVFAGERATFRVILQNDSDTPRHAIDIATTTERIRVDIAARARHVAEISVATRERGYLRMPTLSLATVFPLGLWRTWSRAFALDARCLVYPQPGPVRPLPVTPDVGDSTNEQRLSSDGDDFGGLREFHAGDPVQRVAWKKSAGGDGWHTKQFASPVVPTIWLAWDAVPERDIEQRISALCRWVLMADASESSYGLRLPGLEIAPNRGGAHRDQCLEQLALYRPTS